MALVAPGLHAKLVLPVDGETQKLQDFQGMRHIMALRLDVAHQHCHQHDLAPVAMNPGLELVAIQRFDRRMHLLPAAYAAGPVLAELRTHLGDEVGDQGAVDFCPQLEIFLFHCSSPMTGCSKHHPTTNSTPFFGYVIYV